MEAHNFIGNSSIFPLTFNGRISRNANDILGGIKEEKQDTMIPEDNAIYHMPVLTTQWAHILENPLNYFQFLTETNQQMCYSMHPQHQTFISEHSQLEQYVSLNIEGYSTNQIANLEHPIGLSMPHSNVLSQKQVWSSDSSYTPQSQLPSVSKRKRSREKAYAADRSRILRVSHALSALQEVVPHPKVVDRGAYVDLVIDYVKHLQCQMKDLSQRRLGGEPTSSSVLFLEGHGHFIIHEQALEGPVEETLGKLIAADPSAAYELLQSRGLILMPTSFAEGLHEKPWKGFSSKKEVAIPPS